MKPEIKIGSVGMPLSDFVVSSGSFGTYIGKLRTLELIEGKRDALKASDDFFN